MGDYLEIGVTTNKSTRETGLSGGDPEGLPVFPFEGDCILSVDSRTHDTKSDGIRSYSLSRNGVVGNGHIGVQGNNQNFRGEEFTDGIGVQGNSTSNIGVQGNSENSIGVEGNGSTGVFGNGQGIGVLGESDEGVGVIGTSNNSIGVLGSGIKIGVKGYSEDIGIAGKGNTGVEGNGDKTGVIGLGLICGVRGNGTTGVIGIGNKDEFSAGVSGVAEGDSWGSGVLGKSTTKFGNGVYGVCVETKGIGVYGKGSDNGFGVFCSGNLAATGTKSALVPHPDGSHRAFYCMESPQSWFEDFGIGELDRGTATVHLDQDFSMMVNTDSYHVFLTPEGDSNGLYISKKTPTSFEVREQQGGSNSLNFSYRVVAKRKDVSVSRFEKMTLPMEEMFGNNKDV